MAITLWLQFCKIETVGASCCQGKFHSIDGACTIPEASKTHMSRRYLLSGGPSRLSTRIISSHALDSGMVSYHTFSYSKSHIYEITFTHIYRNQNLDQELIFWPVQRHKFFLFVQQRPMIRRFSVSIRITDRVMDSKKHYKDTKKSSQIFVQLVYIYIYISVQFLYDFEV